MVALGVHRARMQVRHILTLPAKPAACSSEIPQVTAATMIGSSRASGKYVLPGAGVTRSYRFGYFLKMSVAAF